MTQKPVKGELLGQNYVARAFSSIVRNMAHKKMNMTCGYDTKNIWTLQE